MALDEKLWDHQISYNLNVWTKFHGIPSNSCQDTQNR